MGIVQSAEANHVSGDESWEEITETRQVTTENGAKSYATVNDALVELFFKSVRDIPCTDYQAVPVKKGTKKGAKGDLYTKVRHVRTVRTSDKGPKTLEDYFWNAWDANPVLTLKFVFYLRDCRGGKGEKKLFRALIRALRDSIHCDTVVHNMDKIPTYGSWKDIVTCFFGTWLEDKAIKLIAKQLVADRESETPSLCAKYAPSEGGAVDRKYKAAFKIAKHMGLTPREYRKLLAGLRAKLNVVERDMCAKKWDSIEYQKVPSIAGSRYKDAFVRHDSERYAKFLTDVKSGKAKMNTAVLMPHEIVGPYCCHGATVNETLEAQWVSFVTERKKLWPEGLNVLPLVDVSGSMMQGSTPAPISVAVALGMLFAKLNTAPGYGNKFITFSSSPEIIEIKGETLRDQVANVISTQWAMNTNFSAVFDLILKTAKMFNTPQDSMPDVLLVLSDMQFDTADPRNGSTNWEHIEKQYEEAGYKRPTILFWNLAGRTTDFPVPNAKVPDCGLLGGYSDMILYKILEGNMPSPAEIVFDALSSPRYDPITL